MPKGRFYTLKLREYSQLFLQWLLEKNGQSPPENKSYTTSYLVVGSQRVNDVSASDQHMAMNHKITMKASTHACWVAVERLIGG